MFKLQIKSGDKRINYKPLSVTIKFLIDDKKFINNFNAIEKSFNIKLSELQKKNFLSKEIKQINIPKFDGKPDEIILTKINPEEGFTPNYFRNFLSKIIDSLKDSEVKNLHIIVPEYEYFERFFSVEANYYQSFIEGIYYGNYFFNSYKSDVPAPKDLTVFLHSEHNDLLDKLIGKSKNLMLGVKYARNLQNEPASEINPETLGISIQNVFKNENVKVKIIEGKELEKKNMNGILAVGKGSDTPPRLIHIEYKPAKEDKKTKRVAIVGKGITFDSGGISIKPSESMDEMKADMSGAAVVAGTILAASKAKLNVSIIGIIPAAENMPSGKSFRPGDIIRTSSGKTIEVLNTDAEGRIILADALDFASKQKPDYIIDLATLTGACVVALGEFVAGLFSNSEELSQKLLSSSNSTYERIWPMPMWDDYDGLIKSEIADVKNLGGKWGGAITAAKFLQKFVDKKIAWAHLDIAGPSMSATGMDYSKKLMSGFGVRLLFDFLEKLK